MGQSNQVSSTDKNLDRFAKFLNDELERPSLAKQVPIGAHIFHGSYSDTSLTQVNLKLASKILLGMTLGYVEEAPLMMVFEDKPGHHMVIDLSTVVQKDKAQRFIETFQDQSQQEMGAKINELIVD